ncbi:hypothetical protein C817_04982 [Dorea sp. 5-2]|nr:hypothetical protein C817_04982 [Dorea sp. 5-2]
MTETQKNPLAESFNAVSLIRFAFPSMVMMLFMGLYTINVIYLTSNNNVICCFRPDFLST